MSTCGCCIAADHPIRHRNPVHIHERVHGDQHQIQCLEDLVGHVETSIPENIHLQALENRDPVQPLLNSGDLFPLIRGPLRRDAADHGQRRAVVANGQIPIPPGLTRLGPSPRPKPSRRSTSNACGDHPEYPSDVTRSGSEFSRAASTSPRFSRRTGGTHAKLSTSKTELLDPTRDAFARLPCPPLRGLPPPAFEIRPTRSHGVPAAARSGERRRCAPWIP